MSENFFKILAKIAEVVTRIEHKMASRQHVHVMKRRGFSLEAAQAEYRPGLIVCLSLLILIITGCASTNKPGIKPIAQPHATLIDYALSLQGAPYRYGKESPEEGFDCSGFVRHVYGRHGIWLPRTVREMASYLPAVSRSALQSGDLVLFNTGGSHYFSHIGIFIRNDQFIHASSSRSGKVLVSSLNNVYWRKHFVGVRRPKAH